MLTDRTRSTLHPSYPKKIQTADRDGNKVSQQRYRFKSNPKLKK